MAANDYYTSFSPNTSSAHHNRTDAPLPSVPANQSQQSISPVSSPFDDRRYEYPSTHNLTQHQQPMGYSDTAYHGASSQHRYDSNGHGGGTDPFADQNAIPLQQHGKVGGSPTRYQADPEERLYPQPYGGNGKRKKKGWFTGRVTWVVYILTTVQIGVFVGELIKNGTSNFPFPGI